MSEIYRDRSEGTAAKRAELLRRRREELVTMPHAVRRVVVARSARIAASMIATVSGVALLAAAYSPNLAGRLASVMPGIQPAPLSTLLSGAWLLGLVAWAISRARVEHRFAVAMSKYVLPTNDIDHDVERLDHEHPDDIARAMGHQLEVRSAAWPILAAGLVLPATALWIARMARTGGWPVMSEFEQSLALHAKTLVVIALCGAVAAIAMTRKAMRQPAIGTIVLPIGSVASVAAVVGFMKHADIAWALAGLSIVMVGIGTIARMLKKERALLEVEDPAAGAEIFTIRGAIREVRAALAVVRGAMGRLNKKQWVMALAGTSMVVGGALVYHARHVTKAGASLIMTPQQAAVVQAQKPEQLLPVSQTDEPVQYSVTRVGVRFRVDATLDAKGEVVVPMVGFATVPKNWSAILTVEAGGENDVMLVTDAGDKLLSSPVNTTIEACKEPRPLAIHLKAAKLAGTQVSVYVTPVLTTANGCAI